MSPIVTLTTIPTRLTNPDPLGFKACIESLLDQSYPDYQVWINIPEIHFYTKSKYVIPDWLQNLVDRDSKLRIFRTDDFGPATKLLPTVERVLDEEQIIIVADDDLVYHIDMVQAQVSNQEKWPESIVGYDGIVGRTEEGKRLEVFGDSRDHYCVSIRKNVKVDILQHYKTVSYKRRFFEEDFFQFCRELMIWDDDKLMASYFSHKKRDRRVTFHETDPVFNSWEEWLEKGGVKTFPVIEHTNNTEVKDGCALFREENTYDTAELSLLSNIISTGYE